MTRLNAAGSAPLYGTYLGGSGDDEGDGIATDASGNAYVTGRTASTNFVTAGAVQGANGGGTDAFVTKIAFVSSGTVPWHPHHSVHLSAGLDVSVDLADGHVDVMANALSVPARGLALTLHHTWDSTLAALGVRYASNGWVSSLTPAIGGALTQTVVYTDASGAVWLFSYKGSPTDSPPYTTYQPPAGQPWQLTTSPITGYSLANVLTGEVMTFDAQGQYVSDTDAYTNQNVMTRGQFGVTMETNSGDRSTPSSQRALAFSYASGLMADTQSPLWQSSGGTQGQHVTYGYTRNYLSSLTSGAGTTDAITASFGYGVLPPGAIFAFMTAIQTPGNHAWSLGYDAAGRLTSITSPASGTVGQAGYTPAYTTALSYSPGQTVVVEGAGSTAPLTHTYTLDAQGQATQTQDGLGNTSSTTYDIDHDATSSTDANGNTTTDAYQYVGPTGSIGLLTQTVRPAIGLYVPGNTPTMSVITNRYDPTTYNLLETDKPEGGVTLYAYDAFHSPITTTMLASDQGNAFCPNSIVRAPGAPGAQPLGTCSYVQQWRASVNHYDSYGERTSTVDGRGFVPSSLRTTSADGSVVPPTPQLDPVQAPLYTRAYTYTVQGDLQSESTPPISTTLNGVTASGPVTTTYGYDGDGNGTGVTSANGNTSTTAYDHLGRSVATTQPPVALWSSTAVAAVNSGGGAAGRFAADAYYIGGSTYAVGQAVDTSGAPNPAPQAVYQSERYGNLSYVVPNLTPGAPYRVRLHFAEIAFGNGAGGGAGSRIFNVSINGAPVLSNFDVYQTAGGPLKALVEEFPATADAGGQITITYTSVKDNAKSSGVEIIPATTPTDRTTYDADGNVVRTSNANGETTTSSYDPWQRLVSTTNPVSGTTLYTYTATEQVATQDPQGNVTQSAYDAAGRLTLTTDPSHNTTQEQYDAVGNTVALTGGTAGAATSVETRTYDARNEVATDTTSGPGLTTPLTTRTSYDGDGNVAQVERPNGDTVYNLYDLTDLLTSTQIDPNPVGKSAAQTAPKYETYSYDAAGNQVTHTDADNRTDSTTLDADNRAVQDVATAPGPGGTTVITTTNSFDPDGNTVAWTRQTQTQGGPVQTQTDRATFDAADRQASSTDNGLTTAYGYDAVGRQRTHTIADGTTLVTTSLDAEGRQTGISEGMGGAGPYASSLGYNANDLPITMTLPGGSGVQEAMGYDPSSRLVTETLAGPASSPATTTLSSSYAYGYNPLNWTTSTTTLSGTDTLAHDAQGRLTSETGPQVVATGGSYKWTYDNNGNLLTQVGDDGYPVTYTYTQAITPNHLQTMVMGNGQPTTYYGYDNRGDTTAITNALGQQSQPPTNALNTHISYDSQARPVQITVLDRVAPSTTTVTATVTLAYNPAGQRSEYTLAEPGQATLDEQFTYRGSMLGQARVTKGGTLLYTDTYLYTDAGAPYELLRTSASGATSRYWYELDGRGNVVALTDVNGKVVDRYAYDSGGELTSDDATNETVPQQLRYAGYWYDEKLSWYWLSVRYYDPEIERFLAPDPSEQDGVCTFAYVDNDPVDATDPSGLCLVLLHFEPARFNSTGNSYVDLPANSKHASITTTENPGLTTSPSSPTWDFAAHPIGGKIVAEVPANEADYFPYGHPGDGSRGQIQPAYTVVNNTEPCAKYNADFTRIGNAFEARHIPYNFLGPNSNSAAATYIRDSAYPEISSQIYRLSSYVRMSPDPGTDTKYALLFGYGFFCPICVFLPAPNLSGKVYAPGWDKDLLRQRY